MNNIRLATLVSLVTLSILPATSAFALPIDFDTSTKIKLIEVGIDALKSTKGSSKPKTQTTPTVLEKTPSEVVETEVAETEVTETTAQTRPTTTLATPVQATQLQQIQCAQVQQQCLEVSYSTRSIGVYQGGALQQTLPLVNGQAVYNVSNSGVSTHATYPIQNTYPGQQPLGYPQPMQPVYGVSPIQPVYAPNPGVYGYPNVYPQQVYNPNIQSIYGAPAPFVQAVPRVSPQQQQEVMVINVEPKAEAQTIILDHAYPAQRR